MFKALRDPSFARLFAGAVLVLGALVFLCYRLAWYDVSATSVAGTYHRGSVRFLKVDSLPEKLVLHENGTMGLFAADGTPVFEGAWEWDEKERVVRSDAPRWDRQIRLRSTLTGPRLSMRISALPLEIDHPEHDEEVDLIKDDAGE